MLNLAMRVEDANMVGQGSESNWSIVKKISNKERELRIVVVFFDRRAKNCCWYSIIGFNIWNCLYLWQMGFVL